MTKTSSCCSTENDHDHKGNSGFSFDLILHGSIAIILLSIAASFIIDNSHLHHFAHTCIELLSQMWWGIALGIIFVGLMSLVPRKYFGVILGKGDSFGGVLRAMAGGLFFDLCSHGILMIGAKLYERGASLAQVLTFLIASPWNSFSMTFILAALIGWNWTLLFIALSAVIAMITGLIIIALTKAGKLPQNPNIQDAKEAENFDLKAEAKKDLKDVKWNFGLVKTIIKGGLHEAQMLLKWLLLGIVLAAAIRAFIPTENFADWFGPTMAGLGLTLIATTIIEVCSEGSSPIAAELLNRAKAPGNAFTFLMAGVSTDYTEIMILKETTKKWSMALILPVVTVPQVIIIGYILNMAGG